MSSEKSSEQPVCLGCQVSIATPLFCFACNSIQRLSSKPNYFEIFDLPYSYDLDLKKLEDRYQKLAIELHPDFYLSASNLEKRQSQESSTLLNQAYSTLKSPIARAEYLLELLTHGKKFDQRQLPNGFLEEIFTLQESLEDLLTGDPDSSEIERFQTDIEHRLDGLHKELSKRFSQVEIELENRNQLLETIQLYLNEGRYLQRLLDRIFRSDHI